MAFFKVPSTQPGSEQAALTMNCHRKWLCPYWGGEFTALDSQAGQFVPSQASLFFILRKIMITLLLATSPPILVHSALLTPRTKHPKHPQGSVEAKMAPSWHHPPRSCASPGAA